MHSSCEVKAMAQKREKEGMILAHGSRQKREAFCFPSFFLNTFWIVVDMYTLLEHCVSISPTKSSHSIQEIDNFFLHFYIFFLMIAKYRRRFHDNFNVVHRMLTTEI